MTRNSYMIYKYFLNMNANEKSFYEMLSDNCFFVPIKQGRIEFGKYSNCKEELICVLIYFPN